MNRLAFYETNEDLEEEDVGLDTPLYSIDFYNKEYIIALGNERKLDAKKNTYYFPVYLVTDVKEDPSVFKQIGVFEFESDEKSQKERKRTFLDKDGDVDPKRLQDILLYHFANRDFFEQSTFAVDKSDIAYLEDLYSRANRKSSEASAAPNLDDPLELNVPVGKMSESAMKSREVLKDGIFDRDPTIKPPSTLIEENKEDSLKMKKEFQPSPRNFWVANFMKNNNYDVVITSTNGDCYFDTIRIAFLQIGYVTTIEKLRAIAANSADEQMFNYYKSQYNELLKGKIENEQMMQTLRKDNDELKKVLSKIPKTAENKDQIQAIKEKIEENAEKYKEIKEFLTSENGYTEVLDIYKFIQDIDTLEELKEYMKTSDFWADENTIATLERELNFKTIVFGSYNYKNGDLNRILEDPSNYRKLPKKERDNVFICTTGEPPSIEPQFYIMSEHDGRHFRLISYKNKYVFTFPEIPYDIKIMTVIKCMEGSGGLYNRIASFRNFQAKLGISLVGGDNDSDSDSDENSDKIGYDPNIVLVFYNKSADNVAPGKSSHEKVPTEKYSEYSGLFLKKNREWRKKLDDDWPSEFKLDGLRWYSVEHYYQASKFRKMHPEFYKSFSLEGNPDISKDVEMARIAGSKSGAYKDTQLRPVNIKVDSDFYGGRYREEREKAIYAKFSQNEDLKKILLLTKDAKLMKYVPKREMETDYILMKVRKLLRTE
jgi:hypothetical protein